ncbi:N-(5'-phosphoribosyl)anthranilate isomerase [Anoxybacillus sp. BCO1]|nr:N-(5'-phosphoribosyl)anthranilate isomerase [Anoxybacillus sp. BCO1]
MTVLKYCGNRSLQDVQLVAKSEADYIGFVFAESKRKVKPQHVKRWLSVVQLETKQIVGVFVHPTMTSVASVLAHVPLSIIQCHGMETTQTVKQLKENVPTSCLESHSSCPRGVDIYARLERNSRRFCY